MESENTPEHGKYCGNRDQHTVGIRASINLCYVLGEPVIMIYSNYLRDIQGVPALLETTVRKRGPMSESSCKSPEPKPKGESWVQGLGFRAYHITTLGPEHMLYGCVHAWGMYP